MPNHWILGSAIVWVDKQDHVDHPPRCVDARCQRDARSAGGSRRTAVRAPPVLEFDQEGNLVSRGAVPARASSGRRAPWHLRRDQRHGLIAGNGAQDGQIQKFTRDGKFSSFGFGWANADRQVRLPPAGKVFDEPKEAYIADGYASPRGGAELDTGEFAHLGRHGNAG
jgi:hypothetical protein